MNKQIFYAKTAAELELPVIDVTHPAFKLDLTEAELRQHVTRFLADHEKRMKIPRVLRDKLMRFALRNSPLGKAILASRGSVFGSIGTYVLKLGPDNLGSWAKPIDRRIAESLPALAIRLRIQDMAKLMADSLLPALRVSRDRPLHFLNLAGGTAMDSLNALLVLREGDANILARPVTIDVLDRDSIGPEFGERALRALQAPGAPLEGLSITFRHVPWDWHRDGEILSTSVAAARAAHAVTIASSEGGLFEYGDDNEITDALTRLGKGDLVGVAGSVTRADKPIRRLGQDGQSSARPRGLEAFRRLIAPTGWTIGRVIERPFSDHVTLSR